MVQAFKVPHKICKIMKQIYLMKTPKGILSKMDPLDSCKVTIWN
jgi:hypothetical protein